MNNFDFTQFITFDSALSYEVIQDNIEKILDGKFFVTKYANIEEVKKDYFSDYWGKYSFELKKDDFLGSFMKWELVENVPELVEEFVNDINEMLMLDISNLRIIICSFAEKEKTGNEFVRISKNNLYEELFKMSPFSFVCPDNLIIEIR